MNRLFLLAATVALAICACPPLSAHAQMLSFSFTGHVHAVTDDSNILLGAVTPGDSFSLDALFDADTPDLNTDPVWGAYESIGTVNAPRLMLDLPGLAITSPAASAVIADDLPAPAPNPPFLDLFRLEAAFDTIALGRHIAFFVQLLLIDSKAAAFDSIALPLISPDPALFSSARQLIITGALIDGSEQFTLLATVSIPTPGALVLCAIACLPLLRRPQRTT